MNRARWVTWALWAIALAALFYLAGLTAWLGLAGLNFPYQLDYGEGFLLHFVREWANGRSIYKAAEGYPYVMANYPPLPIALALALTPVTGIAYAAGRIWTLIALVAIGAISVAWVRQGRAGWLPAVAAALLFLGSPYVYDWAPLFRVDLIGLALTLGGLYVIAHLSPPACRPLKGGLNHLPRLEGGGRLLLLAALLFVAALYAKQSFLFAPAAAVAYLFFFRSRRQAILLAALTGALGGVLFLLVNALTRGGFWYGLVASNVNPFVWPEFWKQQADFFGTFFVLVLLAGWYAIDKFARHRQVALRDKVGLLDLYLPAALASVLMAGKAGAWENYFFEALLALALAAGLGLARLERGGAGIARVAAPLLVLAQVAIMWHTPRTAERYLDLTRRSNEGMAPVLAAAPDPIASEDMGLLVTNGRTMEYCSFQYSQLARAGRWDQAWELGRLRDGAWSLVILERGTRLDVDRYGRFTREFLSELDRNYRHDATVGKYEVYRPDSLAHERRADFGEALSLAGWTLHADPPLVPGDTVKLTVVWQAQGALAKDYTAFAHLVDETGQGWAGDDHAPYEGLYPTSQWGAGEMVRDTFTLTIPMDAPAELYDVHVGWYDPVTGERLPVAGATSARVAVLPVGEQPVPAGDVQPVDIRFEGGVALDGYRWQLEGDEIVLRLRWHTETPLDADYTVFVHLVEAGGGGAPLSQGDAPPVGGRWPTYLWLPGIAVDDMHRVPLPASLAPGAYDLLVGLYDPETGTRLPLAAGGDAVRIQAIPIR
ncbi:MAG: hypothetical protein JXA93_12680 [Anaerolineae bacterium]|nr:hypothetical protein [Anaerolineae bacterium]